MAADLPTRLDLFALGRAYVLANAKKIDPKIVDVKGSDANIVVGAQAVMSEAVVRHLAGRTAAHTLEGAEGDDLDRWVFERCDRMTRKGAAAARGMLTLARPSLALGSGDVDVGTIVQNDDNVDYVLTSPATFGATDFVSTARARAVKAGSFTRSGPNTIRRFAKPGVLFDTSITVTNTGWFAGATDREEDPELRARARLYPRASRRGILRAIELGALAVPGVATARAEEVTTEGGTPARLVVLYIADESGVASDVLASEVEGALDEYRAGGINVVVSTSITQIVQIAIRLVYRAKVDTVTIGNRVRRAIVERVNGLEVNSPLYFADLAAVIARYQDFGVVPEQSSIVNPVGDLIPDTGYTIRTTLADVVLLP